jgi:hypothetical protein
MFWPMFEFGGILEGNSEGNFVGNFMGIFFGNFWGNVLVMFWDDVLGRFYGQYFKHFSKLFQLIEFWIGVQRVLA